MNKQKTFQDPKLKISFPTTTFEMLFEVAQRCTHDKKKDRPNMVAVSNLFSFNNYIVKESSD